MKKIKIAACLLGLAISASSWAHVGLKQTSPAQDAMLMDSPSELSLTFSGKVRLIKVSVSNDNQASVAFGFKPSADAAVTYQWPLPALATGTYGVDWTALGEDGHKMSGEYLFTLHGPDMMKEMPMKGTAHNVHQH
ncbi:copper resistance CopC family protein [uncultured Paraglaciecola sp.]|uniref:copper resistance CopC family protein n=1 Tax=uncultured Paraglaciecola sp. TaxID=1765024 RepID=UPI0030D74EAF|tara:strand:- start:5886 stop:6293 length:408 start_codon:yes stop_codon:yes gene_type:complete